MAESDEVNNKEIEEKNQIKKIVNEDKEKVHNVGRFRDSVTIGE